MNLKEILQKRYAAKKFDKTKKVSTEKLNKILELTNLTATSYGLQPFMMVAVKNQELKQKLVKSSYGQTNIADSSHLIVFAARTDIDENYINNFVKLTEEIRNLPEGKLSSLKNMLVKSFSEKKDDEIYDWASKQAYIALGTFLIACADEGIDSCPIGGFIPEEYDKILNLSEYNLRSVVVAAIGYGHPDDKYRKSAKVRKPLNEMVIEIG